MPRSKQFREVLIVLAVSLVIAGTVGAVVPFSTPESVGRVAFLRDVVARRPIAAAPYPLGYVGFAGLLMRVGGTTILTASQAAVYVLTVLFSYATLIGLGVRDGWRVAGALAVAFYPNLLMAVTRFQDTGLTCFLLTVFAWLMTRLKRDGFSPANVAIGGLLFGALLLVRPNAITLAPVAVWAGLYGRRATAGQLAGLGAGAAIAFVALAAVLVPTKGRLVVFDRFQAAYTFGNGTHEHALKGTLEDYNGERTMSVSLEEHRLKFADFEQTTPELADEYISFAFQFIRDHPFHYAALELVKTLNLFRPDYRNVGHSLIPGAIGFVVHTAIAGVFFVWAALRWRCRHLMELSDGLILIPTVMLYLAPFVATNSDPRYRVHLEPLFILESVVCFGLLCDARARATHVADTVQSPMIAAARTAPH